MQKFFLLATLLVFSFLSKAQKKNFLLWYNQPAKEWNEALPIGNGRLGAMIFGRPDTELIQLNEETLWTGGPVDKNPNPDAPKFLQPLREALFRDSINQAIQLLKKMQGPNTEMYQPLGDIILKQELKNKPTAYYRDLDISNAVSTTRYTIDDITYIREIFSSAPDNIIIIKWKASKSKALNFTIDVAHELKYEKLVNHWKKL